MEVAKEVCGVKQKSVENPWMVGREEELAGMRRRISAAVERRNEAVRDGEDEEIEAARREVTVARSESKSVRRGWEKVWWERVWWERAWWEGAR